ncbi:MAG: PH domain-containing protein [Marmoricola sp.]
MAAPQPTDVDRQSHPGVDPVLPNRCRRSDLGAARDGDGGWAWEWIGVAIPVAIGLWRYLTTRWRITSTQVQLKRGLIGRQILVAPLDRIRSVELTATLIHRILGLTRVRIGTGQSASSDGDGFTLDSRHSRKLNNCDLGCSALRRRALTSLTPKAPLAPRVPLTALSSYQLSQRRARCSALTRGGRASRP